MRFSASSRARTLIPPRRRRWPKIFVGVLIALLALVYFTPAIVCAPRVRDAILRIVVPAEFGRLQLDSLSLGWTAPVEARGIRFRSPSMEFVAESARCDRTLLDLVQHPSDLGRIELAGPTITLDARTAVATGRGADRAPVSRRDGSKPAGKTASSRSPLAAVAVEFQMTRGAVAVLRGDRPTWVARDLSAALHAPAGGDAATFELSARTGDSAGTARIAASGKLHWPIESTAAAFDSGECEFVGLDLAMLAQLLYRLDLLDAGTRVAIAEFDPSGVASGRVTAKASGNGATEANTVFDVESFALAKVAVGGIDVAEPRVTASATIRWAGDTLTIDAARLRSSFFACDAAGTISKLAGSADAELAGSIQCDWSGIASRCRSILPQELELAGRERRPWRLRGLLADRDSHSLLELLDANVATHVEWIALSGVETGPVEIAGRSRDGRIEFEPIRTTVQGGRLDATPTIVIDGDSRVLRLAPGRVLDQIVIDPKLCELIARYIDPLLAGSGKLTGRLSLDIDRFEMPLAADAAERGTIEGKLVLDDVEFVPGGRLADVLAMTHIPADTVIRTTQTVAVRLAGGRIHHHGLTLPINGDEVKLDGWVGLDRTVSMHVRVPVTEQLVRDKRAYRLLRGQTIDVPVGGTLDHIQIDDAALSKNVQRLIQVAVKENITGGELFKGLLKRALQ